MPDVILYLEFSIEFQSNNLIYQKEYTKRQQVIYVLIQHPYNIEAWGLSKDIQMVESEWNKDPNREEMVQFIGNLSLKEKT
jgi:hypothetical protein